MVIVSFSVKISSQEVAVLKYNGGGDWYSNQTAVPNLIKFANKNSNTKIKLNQGTVAVGSIDLFNFPVVFMTGHGNVFFTEQEAQNLRNYLTSGGFLHVSDNYGLDKYIRREMDKVFPELKFQEIPSNHPIYNQTFIFKNGLPKIHEHDKKPSLAYGLYFEGKMICLYTSESDLGDGWEDAGVHNDPLEIRTKALQMGANIIYFVFNQTSAL